MLTKCGNLEMKFWRNGCRGQLTVLNRECLTVKMLRRCNTTKVSLKDQSVKTTKHPTKQSTMDLKAGPFLMEVQKGVWMAPRKRLCYSSSPNMPILAAFWLWIGAWMIHVHITAVPHSYLPRTNWKEKRGILACHSMMEPHFPIYR